MVTTAVHTILLVDDETTVRDGIGQALESAGYKVARCADGAEAISWLKLHATPSVMIGDVHMPGIDDVDPPLPGPDAVPLPPPPDGFSLSAPHPAAAAATDDTTKTSTAMVRTSIAGPLPLDHFSEAPAICATSRTRILNPGASGPSKQGVCPFRWGPERPPNSSAFANELTASGPELRGP